MPDLRRFAINQITTRDWTLEQAVNGYARQGVAGIGVWMEYLDAAGIGQGARLIRDAGLFVPCLCTSAWVNIADKGGFAAALDENRRRLDAAAEIGAPCLVIVPGGLATANRRRAPAPCPGRSPAGCVPRRRPTVSRPDAMVRREPALREPAAAPGALRAEIPARSG